MSLEDIEKTVRKVNNVMYPETGLICIENTYHGKAVSLEYCKNVRTIANKYNLPLHLDGARVFNAVHALDIQITDLT